MVEQQQLGRRSLQQPEKVGKQENKKRGKRDTSQRGQSARGTETCRDEDTESERQMLQGRRKPVPEEAPCQHCFNCHLRVWGGRRREGQRQDKMVEDGGRTNTRSHADTETKDAAAVCVFLEVIVHDDGCIDTF